MSVCLSRSSLSSSHLAQCPRRLIRVDYIDGPSCPLASSWGWPVGLNKRPERRRNQVRGFILLAPSLCGHFGLATSLSQRPRWPPPHKVLGSSTCSLIYISQTHGCSQSSAPLYLLQLPYTLLRLCEQSLHQTLLEFPNPSVLSISYLDLHFMYSEL